MILNDRAINTPVRPVSRHQAEWAASGLRRAATEAGVALPIDYNPAGAADGLTRATQLAVSRLGAGVVLLTQPSSDRELPVVVATPMDEASGTETATATPQRPPPGRRGGLVSAGSSRLLLLRRRCRKPRASW